MSAAANATPARRSGARWLLLGSLALNLFFLGAAVALAIRPPGPPPPPHHHNVFARVDRLAATLPPADGAILKQAMRADHAAIAKAQQDYHAAREGIRATLRVDPFKVADMRAAMAKTRAARLSFDLTIEDVFANAASKMSPAGRHALADWHPRHGRDRKRQ